MNPTDGLRLVGEKNPTFKNSAYFFAAAAEAMRHILIDRARRKQTERHGGSFERVEMDEFELAAPSPDDELLAVHEVLDALSVQYPVQANRSNCDISLALQTRRHRRFLEFLCPLLIIIGISLSPGCSRKFEAIKPVLKSCIILPGFSFTSMET